MPDERVVATLPTGSGVLVGWNLIQKFEGFEDFVSIIALLLTVVIAQVNSFQLRLLMEVSGGLVKKIVISI